MICCAAEVWEAETSMTVVRKSLRADSGGAGRFRGGLGQVLEVGSLDAAPFGLSALYDRIDHPPRGRGGGRDGAAGSVVLASGRALRGKGLQTVPKGDRAIISMPGGGGLGDPLQRDPVAVAADVRLGLVSPEAARDSYGVAVTPDGTVDRPATAALRAVGRAVRQ
jgi:N-methylhydantoinase B